MEFRIQRLPFLQGLAAAQGVVERRSTIPILANVLIQAIDGGVRLLATDLEVGVIRRLREATVEAGGAVSVGARKLFEIVRELEGDEVRVKGLQNHGIEVRAGRSVFRLAGIDAAEFPSVPGIAEAGRTSSPKLAVELLASTLDRMIESTIFAVSQDEGRFHLSGVFVEKSEQGLRMVATDGHRLALADGEAEGKLPERGCLLPRKGLVEAKKMLEGAAQEERVQLAAEASIARVRSSSGEVFMRLVEGEFPDYRQVIPKSSKLNLTLDREQFLGALRRVSLLATERSRGVRLTLEEGCLRVKTENPDLGEGEEEIEVAYDGGGLSIGFNARYLMEALGVLRETKFVRFGLNDDVSPGLLVPEGDERFQYVVMPMRL
jgi:DNA polymerase-3 subunit beta